SKLMSPGVRIGWMRAEGPVLDTLAVAKAAISMQSSVVDQLTVARYLETADLDAHVAHVSALYRERRDAMAAAIAPVLPAGGRAGVPRAPRRDGRRDRAGAARRRTRHPPRGRDVAVGGARRGLRRADDALRGRRGRGRVPAGMVLLRRRSGPFDDAAQLRHPLPRRDRGRRRPPG